MSSDVSRLIDEYEKIPPEHAEQILEALRRKGHNVVLNPVEATLEETIEPPLLTRTTGTVESSEIHTYICSATTKDAMSAYLWLDDAYRVLGHMPRELATLKATFGHAVGVSLLGARVETLRRLAEDHAAQPVEEEPEPPSA